MAVGDGGFKQVAFGFDKNEVNAYISDLRKKMKSMEEEVKANNKKTEEALKLAEEADERIKAAVKEVEDKLIDAEKQLSVEQERAAKYKGDVDSLKKELESEKKKMSDMLISGKGVSSEAQKAYTEVLEKAKTDAQAIIGEADEKAAQIIAKAEEKRAAADKNTNEFLETLKAQLDTITAGYNSISASASELFGTQLAEVAAPVVSTPVAAPKPQKAAVVAAPIEEEPAEETVKEAVEQTETVQAVEKPVVEEEPVEEEAAVVEEGPAAEDAVPVAEAVPSAQSDGGLASFDDVWGGNELAQTIFNKEKKDAVPLVNPEQKNLFGEDLFKGGEDIKVEELTDNFEPDDDTDVVEEIMPLDVSDVAEAKYNDSFDNDLLSQTMASGSMGEVNEQLLAAVKEAEAAFVAQPGITELDMEEESAATPADELMKALLDAEAAFSNMAAPSEVSMDDDDEPAAASDTAGDSDNLWADMEKQLAAMASMGAAVDEAPAAEPTSPAVSAPADPAAPSADDSAIWNFGSTGGDSSDDDMSGDMFGGFGGF